MGENVAGVIVKYHPCTRYARGSDCPYFDGSRRCGREPLKCEMPEYDRWYVGVLEGRVKCFYPNRIVLLETPGVSMFLYHVDFHAIVGEAVIKRAEVKDGAHYYFFDSFTRYPYPVLLELITTDEKVPRLARRGRWLYIYISKETVNEIRNLSKISDETKVKLGIDLERVLLELQKRPAARKPDWRTFLEGEISRLRETHLFEEQVLDWAKGYFSEAASGKFFKGRSKEELFYASLYLAVRMLQIPLKLSDITRISNLKPGRLMNIYSLLVGELNLNPPLMNPTKIVSYYAKNLNVKRRTLNRAISIIEKAKGEGATSGSDPFSIAATATYLACQAENEKLTQDEVGRVFGVTSATIRNNAKKLNKFIKTI